MNKHWFTTAGILLMLGTFPLAMNVLGAIGPHLNEIEIFFVILLSLLLILFLVMAIYFIFTGLTPHKQSKPLNRAAETSLIGAGILILLILIVILSCKDIDCFVGIIFALWTNALAQIIALIFFSIHFFKHLKTHH